MEARQRKRVEVVAKESILGGCEVNEEWWRGGVDVDVVVLWVDEE
jgi:hypothetical protein